MLLPRFSLGLNKSCSETSSFVMHYWLSVEYLQLILCLSRQCNWFSQSNAWDLHRTNGKPTYALRAYFSLLQESITPWRKVYKTAFLKYEINKEAFYCALLFGGTHFQGWNRRRSSKTKTRGSRRKVSNREHSDELCWSKIEICALQWIVQCLSHLCKLQQLILPVVA